MLAYIPLAWFSILLLLLFLRKGFCVSTYLVFLYVLSSYCTILLKNASFGAWVDDYISFIPTVIYCAGITIMILPLSKISSDDFSGYIPLCSKLFTKLTWFYFGVFVLLIVLNWKTLVFIISYGDFGQLRRMVYNDELVGIDNFSNPIIRLLVIIVRTTGLTSFVMIPIFFINLLFLKKPLWFCLLALLASTNVIVTGILGIDRSSVFRWFLLVGLNVSIFWKYFGWKHVKALPFITALFIVFLGYFMAVSEDRADMTRDKTTSEGILSYAGMSYPNFCKIYDTVDNGEGLTFIYIFPTIHKYILKDYKGNVERQEEMTAKNRVNCNVFYTVFGSFVLDGNKPGPILYIIFYTFILSLLVKNYNKRINQGYMFHFLLVYYFMIILTFGFIAYPFTQGLLKPVYLVIIWLFYKNEHSNKRLLKRK